MDAFTAADIDGGCGAVTPLLYIGEPPLPATLADNPVAAVEMMKDGRRVYFMDSTSAYHTLILLGVEGTAAYDRLLLARFGPLRAS